MLLIWTSHMDIFICHRGGVVAYEPISYVYGHREPRGCCREFSSRQADGATEFLHLKSQRHARHRFLERIFQDRPLSCIRKFALGTLTRIPHWGGSKSKPGLFIIASTNPTLLMLGNPCTIQRKKAWAAIKVPVHTTALPAQGSGCGTETSRLEPRHLITVIAKQQAPCFLNWWPPTKRASRKNTQRRYTRLKERTTRDNAGRIASPFSNAELITTINAVHSSFGSIIQPPESNRPLVFSLQEVVYSLQQRLAAS